MSPASPTPSFKRPPGFYDDWNVFCAHVLSTRIGKPGTTSGNDLAVILLAGGGVLGGVGLASLVNANKEAIDAQGKEWGIKGLSSIMGVGSVVLGVAMSGLGLAWATRALSRHADAARVDALQSKLAAARREFASLREARLAKRLTPDLHHMAVERLFRGLTTTAA